MPSAAELLAARDVSGTPETPVDAQPSDVDAAIPTPPATKPSFDEQFPRLGNGTIPQTSTPRWGPGMRVEASAAPAANGRRQGPAVPLLLVQSKLEIPLAQLQDLTPAAHVEALKRIQRQHGVTIEFSTVELLGIKLYLLKGPQAAVNNAKKQMAALLVKPTTEQFAVPARARGTIIGAKGATLRRLEQEFNVKVDVGREVLPGLDADSDPLLATSNIQVTGLPAACAEAKKQILQLVDLVLLNVTGKLEVPEEHIHLAPFLAPEHFKIPDLRVEVVVAPNTGRVLLTGHHREVLAAQQALRTQLEQLQTLVRLETAKLPAALHRFVDRDQILAKEHVAVRDGPAPDQVELVGLPQDLHRVQQQLAQLPQQYKGVFLMLDRAHGGNVAHNLLVFDHLHRQRYFDRLVEGSDVVAHYDAPTANGSLLPLGMRITFVYPVLNPTAADTVAALRRQIVSRVDLVTPDRVVRVELVHPFVAGATPAAELRLLVSTPGVVPFVHKGKLHLVYAPEDGEGEVAPAADAGDGWATEMPEDAATAALAAAQQLLQPLVARSSEVEAKVVKFDAGLQDEALGATTQKLVVGTVPPGSVELQLHTPLEGEVTVAGLRPHVALVALVVASIARDHAEHELKFAHAVNVPSKVVGRLVGTKGSFLNELRSEYGVEIDAGDQVEGAATTEVSLTGSKFNVQQVAARIQLLAKRWADELSATVRADPKFHGQIIGGGGANLLRLEDKYDVRIRFPGANSGLLEIVVRGPLRGVAKAAEELEELVLYLKTHSQEKEIVVQQKHIARIIGRGGEQLRDIVAELGAEVDVGDRLGSDELSPVAISLTGSSQGIKKAEALIQQIVAQLDNHKTVELQVDPKHFKLIIGLGGATLRQITEEAPGFYDLHPNDARRLVTVPRAGQEAPVVIAGPLATVEHIAARVQALVDAAERAVTEKVSVPKAKHRVLVGPQGLVRRELEEEFGVSIQIPRSGDSSTEVEVTGDPEKVAAAVARITELTKDSWQHETMVPKLVHLLIADHGKLFTRLRSDFGVDVSHQQDGRALRNVLKPLWPQPPLELDEATPFVVVPHDELQDLLVQVPWQFKGPDAASAEKAKQVVEQLVAQAAAASHDGWYNVPTLVHLRIVGPGGRTVNRIANKSKCFVVVPLPNGNDARLNGLVYVRGTPELLAVAEQELKQAVASKRAKE